MVQVWRWEAEVVVQRVGPWMHTHTQMYISMTLPLVSKKV